MSKFTVDIQQYRAPYEVERKKKRKAGKFIKMLFIKYSTS